MPGTLAWPYTVVEAGLLSLVVAAVALVTVIGFRAWKAARITAEERERRRRALLVVRGKMADAVLVEVRDDLLFFTYAVRGVEYTASQDVSLLKEMVPRDFSSVLAVAVRFLPENPANSIVVAEEWTGLRLGKTKITP
jgi:hypothetical protein